MARKLPQEMIDYLITMLSPPDPYPPAVFYPDVHQVDWESIEDGSLSGLLTVGTPTTQETSEMMRVLKPGAHLLVAAPEDCPTGYKGAVELEDGGFEIRDAILVVEDAEDPFHYVPKVASKEREAGCARLEGRSAGEATGRKDGSAGLNSPRAGASRTAKDVKNFHPTVKPWTLMEKLLEGISEGLVVDPFMGSGSTGIACVSSGHDFIGIDLEPDHVQIATERIRHWDRQIPGFTVTKIESEADEPEPPEEDIFEAMF